MGSTRRDILALLCGGTLTVVPGCSVRDDGDSTIPVIEDRQIRVLDRACKEDSLDQCEAEFDNGGTDVTLTGVVSVDDVSRREDLFLWAQNAVGDADRPDDEIDVDIDPYAPAPADEGTHPACEGTLEYEVGLRLSSVPRRIVVRHREPESRGDPVATFTP